MRRLSDDHSLSCPLPSRITSVCLILDRTDLKHDEDLNDRPSSVRAFYQRVVAAIGARRLFIVGHE
jgi:hypothetical protein